MIKILAFSLSFVLASFYLHADTTDAKWKNIVELTKKGEHCKDDENCFNTINLLNHLLSSYLRYVALIWGADGGVLLSGSIINSLITEEDHAVFRHTFEDSETMREFLKTVPLATLKIKDIGFVGGLEIAKKLL